MSDWFKFEAIMYDKRKKPEHSPPEFPVHIWRATEESARCKLISEYPSRHYEILNFRLITK